MKKAIVLTSGGLHSTTALAIAASRNYEIYAITFDYGQKNRAKLEAAKKQAAKYGVKEHKIVKFDISEITGDHETIPARNNLFVSFALSWAELVGAMNIYIGINSIEYGDNPDCRPSFIHSFEKHANLAMKKIGPGKMDLWSPLMNNETCDTVKRGVEELKIDYSETISCPDANEAGEACGECLPCQFRKTGFEEAGIPDPTRYVS